MSLTRVVDARTLLTEPLRFSADLALLRLPLKPLLEVYRKLLPGMETVCASEVVANKGDADQRAMAWLREQALDNAVPDKGAIVPRPFRWTDQVEIWLASYIWGAAYCLQQSYAIWPADTVRLFYLVQPPPEARRPSASLSASASPRLPSVTANSNNSTASAPSAAMYDAFDGEDERRGGASV